jgi:hypothetical protein
MARWPDVTMNSRENIEDATFSAPEGQDISSP